MREKRVMIASALLFLSFLMLAAALIVGLMPKALAEDGPMVSSVAGESYTDIKIELGLAVSAGKEPIVLCQLTEQPRLGTAKIEGSTLIYNPGHKAGLDRFSYTAVDAEGKVAPPAEISIRIKKNASGLTYADLEGDHLHYPALCLAQQGIFVGEKIGNASFFHPSAEVTRSEFIAMAVSLANITPAQTAQTDFIDDDGLSPWIKPYISAAAADGLISGYELADGCFEICGERTITMNEACVILSRIIGNEQGVVQTIEAGFSSEPDWAAPAVQTLTQMQVITSAQAALGQAELTRRTAADLLYRSYCLLQ